jgi:ribosomal protein L11 methylase PrmA
MQSKLNRYALSSSQGASVRKPRGLSKLGYQGMLMQMLAWIRKMQPKNYEKTVWQDYAQNNTYDAEERSKKYALVRDFSVRHKPSKLVDLGCNTGDYCQASLEGGAEYVLGYDFDQNALDMAYSRSQKLKSAYLPLWMDLANPSPTQGWKQTERDGFLERSQSDAVIALALKHHLAIGRNVPLSDVVSWIVGLAPCGLIEFIPKNDPTVQQMLSLREDIFQDYSEQDFVSALERCSRIIARTEVSSSGRAIYEFER